MWPNIFIHKFLFPLKAIPRKKYFKLNCFESAKFSELLRKGILGFSHFLK